MILIVPHAVADRCRLDEAKVNALDRGIGDGHRCLGCAASGVGLGVGQTSQDARVRINDRDTVGAHSEANKLVVAIGIGHGCHGVAIVIEDGVAIAIEQGDSHAGETLFGRALGEACIGVTVDRATEVVAALEGRRGLVVRRVVARLILVGDTCDVRDERARTFTGDLDGDFDGLIITLGDGLSGQVPHAGGRIVGAVAFSLDELNARRELIGDGDTGCHARTIVGQGQGVGDLLTGGELEGFLIDLVRIGDRLLDGGVSRDSEAPVLIKVLVLLARQGQVSREFHGRCEGGGVSLGCITDHGLVLNISSGGVGENVEQRFGSLESLRIDTHLVVAGQQVLELVLAIRIGRGLVGASDSTRAGPGQSDLHTGQYLVASVGGVATVLVDIDEQLITNDTGTNGTEVNCFIRLILSQGDRGRSSVGVESAVGSGIRGCCRVACRCLEGHLVVAGQQVLELVLAIRVARLCCHRVARSIGHGGAVRVGQGNRHAGQSRFVGILNAIAVNVHPGVVTQGCGLDEAEVHVDDGTGFSLDRHLSAGLVATRVGLERLGAGERTGGRVNNIHLVLTQGKTREGVLAVSVGHSCYRVAILVEDGGAVLLEERNGNTRVGVFTVIRAEGCVGIVVELASDRVTGGQGHRGGVVRGLITELILVFDGRRVGDDRTSGLGSHSHDDGARAGCILLDDLIAQVPLAGGCIVGAVAGRAHESHTRGELILRDDTGCRVGALVRQGDRVGDSRAGGEAARGLGCRIRDGLDDRGVRRTGESPVLRIVAHLARAQSDLRAQGERLVL